MTGSSEWGIYVCRLILIMNANYHLPKKHLTLQHGVSRYSNFDAPLSRGHTIAQLQFFCSENLDCIFSLCYSTVILHDVAVNERSIYCAPSRQPLSGRCLIGVSVDPITLTAHGLWVTWLQV
jgi:hypothetical protein